MDRESLVPADAEPEIETLLARYAVSRDPALREAIIVRNLGLVTQLARRLARSGDQLDDLIQVGFIGLIKAIDRFEPARGVRFTTYAIPTIAGEMRRYLRDRETVVRIPRQVQELRGAIERATEQLTQQLGRLPRAEEVAQSLGLPVEQVEAVWRADPHPARPLEAGEDWSSRAAEEEIQRFEDRLLLEHALRLLTPRQRAILYLRFYEELSQAEIGERLHISQMHVSRLARAALERLRRELLPPEVPSDSPETAPARPPQPPPA